MDTMTRITASKKLSRYKLYLQNDMFHGNVIWCRTAYDRRENTHDPLPNQHVFYELHYVLEGALTISLDGKPAFFVEKGQFVLIPPRQSHQIFPQTDDLEKLVCGFTLETGKDFVKQALSQIQQQAYPATERMPLYVEAMLENALNSKAGAATCICNLLECLLMEMLRQLSPDDHEKNADRKVFENDIRIQELQRYVSQTIRSTTDGERLTGEMVASQLGISLRHLNRLTDRYLSCTVGELIAKERIEYVKSLLYVHELTLRDIAERTGFHSEYALGRFFKNQEGMPIGQYRRSLEQ